MIGVYRNSSSSRIYVVHSNRGTLTSPIHSLDSLFSLPPAATAATQNNSNDLSSLLPSPLNSKTSSPLFSNNDPFSLSPSPKLSASSKQQARNSTRLRQLLANKSASATENPTETLHYHPDIKLEELLQDAESPTSTHLSPLIGDLPSPIKRRQKPALTSSEQNESVDILLKKILGRQASLSSSPVRTESNHSDDSTSTGHTSNKQRSDIFLRVTIRSSSSACHAFAALDIAER